MCTISVIVPVYNDAELLGRCIDSILAQTYNDYELIIVDDGSTDLSGNICDQYAELDKRIKVIHKKNEGVSIARNTGIEKAIGQFICFADADDYVAKEWIKDLYDAQIANPDSFVISNVDIIESDRRYNRYNGFEGLVPIEEVWRKGNWGYSCNKIFSKKRINDLGLSFDHSQVVREDELFVGLYTSGLKTAYIIPAIGYYYENLEPLDEKYSESLTLENAYYEYFRLKESNPICSRYLVDRLLAGVYNSIIKGADSSESIKKFKNAVGYDIAFVFGRKKVLFRLLRKTRSLNIWKVVFDFYIKLKLI